MNIVVLREKLAVALNNRNLVVMGLGFLLLAVFALALILPSLKEAGRLEAAIAEEERRLAQAREVHGVAGELDDRLEQFQKLAPPSREFDPGHRDSSMALRQLADEHGVTVRELDLEIPDQPGPVANMRLRAQLVGDLEPLRRLALEMVWLPSLVELKEIAISRDQAGFVLAAEMMVDDE